MPCSTKVVITTNTGYSAPAPAGSECQGGEGMFTVDLQTGAFEFSFCDIPSTRAPYTLVTGSRTLKASELASLQTTLTTVTVAGRDSQCGADKGIVTIAVASGGGTRHYEDSFYSCENRDVVYVDGIDNAVDAVRALAAE